MSYLKIKVKEICKFYPEIQWEEINGGKDHVHILASIPPKISISTVVRILKTNTSVSLKKKFEFLKEVYWGTDGIWSDGYFVSTVGINEQIIRRYIEYQDKEDSGQAKLAL